jgi:hypothetical protein
MRTIEFLQYTAMLSLHKLKKLVFKSKRTLLSTRYEMDLYLKCRLIFVFKVLNVYTEPENSPQKHLT